MSQPPSLDLLVRALLVEGQTLTNKGIRQRLRELMGRSYSRYEVNQVLYTSPEFEIAHRSVLPWSAPQWKLRAAPSSAPAGKAPTVAPITASPPVTTEVEVIQDIEEAQAAEVPPELTSDELRLRREREARIAKMAEERAEHGPDKEFRKGLGADHPVQKVSDATLDSWAGQVTDYRDLD